RLLRTEIIRGSEGHGILRTEDVGDRAGDGPTLHGLDLAIADVEGRAVGPVEIGADSEDARAVFLRIEPAGRFQGRAVADGPQPAVFEERERLAEVVARGLREVTERGVQPHPVHDVLRAGEAALGLPPLPQIDLKDVDAVECVDAVIDEPAYG